MALAPIISQQFKGVVWRLEIDPYSHTIFTEIRDDKDRNVSFAAVNIITGEVYFDALTTPERWLTGIEAAYRGVLLLHYYQSETGPVHKGVIAVDAQTGATLWSNFNFAFDHLSPDGPMLYDTRLQPRKLFLADIRNGAVATRQEPAVYDEMERHILLPQMLDVGNLPLDLTQLQPFGNMVHYLEYNNFRIVSLHALKDGDLTQLLLIFAGAEQVYEDLINQNIQKIQPEAFMMHNNLLLYIKNKTQLKVLSL